MKNEAQDVQRIRFHLSEERINSLTWEEYEVIESMQDGDLKLYRLRPVLAKFVVDENQKPVPIPQALKQIGKVPINQLKQVLESFTLDLQEGTVPKENEDSLEPPS